MITLGVFLGGYKENEMLSRNYFYKKIYIIQFEKLTLLSLKLILATNTNRVFHRRE